MKRKPKTLCHTLSYNIHTFLIMLHTHYYYTYVNI